MHKRLILLLILLVSFVFIFSCKNDRVKKISKPKSTASGQLPDSFSRLLRDIRLKRTAKEKEQLVKTYLQKRKDCNYFPIKDKENITFVYYGKAKPPICVEGDFNNWKKLADKLKRAPGTDLYYTCLKIPHSPDKGIPYYYAANCNIGEKFIRDPLNPNFIHHGKREPNIVITPGCEQGFFQILSYDLASNIPKIKSRKIVVYLPPTYYQKANKKFPVLYMHDGQNIFDNNQANRGGWHVNRTTDRLIKQGKIEDVVIVGIPNTIHRGAEYAPPISFKAFQEHAGVKKGWGDKYFQYVKNSVMPEMLKRFRIKQGPANTGTAGSSLGGLISLYFSYQHPETFGKAGVVSPAFFSKYDWDKPGWKSLEIQDIRFSKKVKVSYYIDCGDTISVIGDRRFRYFLNRFWDIRDKSNLLSYYNKNPNTGKYSLKKNLTLDDQANCFLVWGKIGYVSDGLPHTRWLVWKLKTLGWKMNQDLFYYEDMGAHHIERDWKRRFHRLLVALFPSKS